MNQPAAKVVALDAMGVLYASADDVSELLVPYLAAHGTPRTRAEIEARYLEASLGMLSSAEFWRACEVERTASDADYCQHHQLTAGMTTLLPQLRAAGYRLAVLGNDVSEWSIELRHRFQLETWIDDWIISGDIRVRKPNREAYAALIETVRSAPHEIIFWTIGPPASTLRSRPVCRPTCSPRWRR